MIDDYLALIPAAGVGSRAQLSTAKQFLKIGEKTILEHAIDPFIKDENCKKLIRIFPKIISRGTVTCNYIFFS